MSLLPFSPVVSASRAPPPQVSRAPHLQVRYPMGRVEVGLGLACLLPRHQSLGISRDRPGGGRSLGVAEAPHPALGLLVSRRQSEAPPAIPCPSRELRGLAGSHVALGEAHLFTGHCPVQVPAVARGHGLSPGLSHPQQPGQAAQPVTFVLS